MQYVYAAVAALFLALGGYATYEHVQVVHLTSDVQVAQANTKIAIGECQAEAAAAASKASDAAAQQLAVAQASANSAETALTTYRSQVQETQAAAASTIALQYNEIGKEAGTSNDGPVAHVLQELF